MKSPTVEKVRLSINLPLDIKAALEELQKKRVAQYSEITLSNLVTEAAMMLLKQEGVNIVPVVSTNGQPHRKGAKS